VWEDNVKIDLKEIGLKEVDWINLDHEGGRGGLL
jgi:hypothetical protein